MADDKCKVRLYKSNGTKKISKDPTTMTVRKKQVIPPSKIRWDITNNWGEAVKVDAVGWKLLKENANKNPTKDKKPVTIKAKLGSKGKLKANIKKDARKGEYSYYLSVNGKKVPGDPWLIVF